MPESELNSFDLAAASFDTWHIANSIRCLLLVQIRNLDALPEKLREEIQNAANVLASAGKLFYETERKIETLRQVQKTCERNERPIAPKTNDWSPNSQRIEIEGRYYE